MSTLHFPEWFYPPGIDIKITPEAAVVSDVGIGAIPDYLRDEVKKAVVCIHRRDEEG